MDFWQVHGIFFVLGLMFIPRITVWFFSAVTGGLLFWLAFLCFPRFVIPFLAVAYYWDTNPVMVVISFFLLWGGEGAEKETVRRKIN